MKLQQYTGPVMAKSLEDTSFYRYFRLISLNEVGGDPRRFGVSVAAFHHMNQERLRRWPHTMLATATHDMKRGEDVRARINVLSEHPAVWQRNLRRWAAVNRPHRGELDGAPAPSADDEYLLYQTLLGAWPVELLDGVDDARALAAFRDRVCAYMTKAQREAKLHSSWTSPNPDYEQATQRFVERVLDPRFGRRFLERFLPAARDIAAFGAMNSLAQTVLKLTVPGVPDIYQGTEMWDLSLVDPDNRRPVDYDLRRRLLAALKTGNAPDPAALMESWRDGRIKLYLTWKLLALRRARPDLFLSGSYLPLEVEGEKAGHVLAFLRRCGAETLLVVVPRLVFSLLRGEARPPLRPEVWGDTALRLPADLPDAGFRDALTGRDLAPEVGDGRLPIGALLSDFMLCVAHCEE
jgi:(1->4)-alpha-D-glucan 1-alpha-D-glucosylmutase